MIKPENHAKEIERLLELESYSVLDTLPEEDYDNLTIKALSALSKQVINLMELRKNKLALEKSHILLEEKNKELERFEFITLMDLKSPLVHISNTANQLSNTFQLKLGDKGLEMLQSIKDSSQELKNLISGLLEFNKTEKAQPNEYTWINLLEFINDIDALFDRESELSIELDSNLSEIYVNECDLNQVLINLVAFSVKSKRIKVEKILIKVEEVESHYRFSSEESGPAFTRIDKERIFKFENILAEKDNLKNIGSGLGLSQINKVLEKCGGSIEIKMDKELGSKFIFTIGKSLQENSLIENNSTMEIY
jgi:light-regulated signal transduction histidine kinase (bacteriophytochrome)